MLSTWIIQVDIVVSSLTVVVFDERDESSDNELDQHPVDSICRGNSIVRRKDLKQDIKFEIVDLETKIMTEGRKKFVVSHLKGNLINLR